MMPIDPRDLGEAARRHAHTGRRLDEAVADELGTDPFNVREMLDEKFESEHHKKFRANRSLRDVEPEVNLFLKDLSGLQVEDSE